LFSFVFIHFARLGSFFYFFSAIDPFDATGSDDSDPGRRGSGMGFWLEYSNVKDLARQKLTPSI
jgi:hypothetical protein